MYSFPESSESVSVSRDGSLQLGFEIGTFPGYIKPQVGLTYSSHGGDSVLGMGWELSLASVRMDLRDGLRPLREAPSFIESGLDVTSGTPRNYLRKRWLASPGGELACEAPTGSLNAFDFDCYTNPRGVVRYRVTEGTDGWEDGFEARDPHAATIQRFGTTAATQIRDGEGHTVVWLLESEENHWGKEVRYFYEEPTGSEARILRAILMAGNKVIRFDFKAHLRPQ